MAASAEKKIPHPKRQVNGILGWLKGRLARSAEIPISVQEPAKPEMRVPDLPLVPAETGGNDPHLILLMDVARDLATVLDQPVAAQLVASAILRAFEKYRAAILIFEDDPQEFVLLAVACREDSYLPPSYRQPISKGIIGRAARTGKAVVVNDTQLDSDYIDFRQGYYRSEIVIPLIKNKRVKGALVVSAPKVNAITDMDVVVLESVAEQLLNSWERSDYHQHLTELINSGISLSVSPDPQTAIKQIAEITRAILEAKFVYVTRLDQEGSGTQVASAGTAPEIISSLNSTPEKDPLIQAILNSKGIIRQRDIRKFGPASHIKLDDISCRSLIAFPIRAHQSSVGAILAFGKQGEPSFTDSDESLADLIASQSAAAVENTWLILELRSTLVTANQLHEMGIQIIEAENLHKAVEVIARTAFDLGHASVAGIVLFDPGTGEVEAQVEIDNSGMEAGDHHPLSLIKQAMQTGQSIIITDYKSASKVCIPIQTSHRTSGALWLDIPEGHWYKPHYSDNLEALARQATVALERMILLAETRDQAKRLAAAYVELETTYDQTLFALMSALDARDRETEGHSTRVMIITAQLADEAGLDANQIKRLERGALLHDIGKIGVSDTILLKNGSLEEAEWEAMRLHPVIGERIVAGIPFLKDSLPVIRHHHERWDGKGYPDGLKGDEIPFEARIFTIADTLDALLSDRPYRRGMSIETALEHFREKAGIIFDPRVVQLLEKLADDENFINLIKKKG
jgi:HD-GYP domain-containing protein (c-di-GMP phosphodiesterase class II)/GAF domain-containing protein